ncbi:hypothetical protein BB558_005543, partial [Smittium angustum]
MKENKSNSLIHLGAGAMSGVSSVVFLQPFDLLKTRVQQETMNPKLVNPLKLNKSIIGNTIKTVYNERGIPGFWRGTVPTLI